jgi:galactokinase
LLTRCTHAPTLCSTVRMTALKHRGERVTLGAVDPMEALPVGTLAAAEKADLLDAALSALEAMADAGTRAGDPVASMWVPGRIEFLGKHTDYAGGRSLLCAVDRGICVAARPRRDAQLRVRDARSGESVSCALDPSLPAPAGRWEVYPATVARRVARNFPKARIGADIAFYSNLPVAAGISSSSALVVSIFLAVAEVNSLPDSDVYRANIRSPEDLAAYLGSIENGLDFSALTGDRGVGTLSGCEDQTAMLCSRPGALIQYSFCPVRAEGVVPLPAGHRFVIAASGVAAEKTASAMEKYNRLSRKAVAAAAAWRAESGHRHATLGDAASVTDADVIRSALARATAGEFSSRELVDRFDQFYLESEVIVPNVAAALRAGDLGQLGGLVDRSQSAVERLLGNQIAETISLARSARSLGAVAASAFGAGFGGSVWALVADDRAATFRERWKEDYLRAFPAHHDTAQFFVTRAGPPAARIV